MKRILFLLMIITSLTFVSCSSEEVTEEVVTEEAVVEEAVVVENTADVVEVVITTAEDTVAK